MQALAQSSSQQCRNDYRKALECFINKADAIQKSNNVDVDHMSDCTEKQLRSECYKSQKRLKQTYFRACIEEQMSGRFGQMLNTMGINREKVLNLLSINYTLSTVSSRVSSCFCIIFASFLFSVILFNETMHKQSLMSRVVLIARPCIIDVR